MHRARSDTLTVTSTLDSAIRDPRFEQLLAVVYVTAALVITIQRGVFSFPNDFAIFRAAFWNLISGQDLYVLRLDQAHDYYKYSPTFALVFAPFAVLPFVVGLFAWNAVNALALFFALRLLFPDQRAPIAQALVFLPMLRSLQSSQSNALVAALIIVGLVCFERGWVWRAAAAIGLGALTKIFPLVALSAALMRPDRTKAIVISVATLFLLLVLPLMVISPAELVAQYRSWASLEAREARLLGSSLMQLLNDVGLNWPAWPIQLVGAAILLTTLILGRQVWADRQFRLQFLAFVLVFCVLFNHRAEQQSSVIAISGMVIWYLATEHVLWRKIIFLAVFTLVSLIGSDVTPDVVKRAIPSDMRLAVPLTLLWIAMLRDLARRSGGSAMGLR